MVGDPLPGALTGWVGAGPAVRNGMVGAGAFGPGPPPTVGAPAVRRGMVGAGAGGRGGPPTAVGVGGAVGTGALTGGAIGRVADGTAGGASAALRVTRTVSFFRGTLEVCLLKGTLEVCLDGNGDWFSLSLMRLQGFGSLDA